MVRATVLRGISVGLVLSVIAGGSAYLLLRAPPGASAPTEAERTRAAAMEQIAAESAGAAEVRSEVAPRTTALSTESAPPATPPEGYAFATYREMASRRMPETALAEQATTDTAAADWLASDEARQRLAEQAVAAGRDWVFGWARRAAGASQGGVEDALGRHGATVIGTAGDLLRVRLPIDPARLAAITRRAEVAAIGALPPELKTPAAFAAEAPERSLGDIAPVFVTLMADDPHGRWRRALEGMGAQVGWFDADTRAYAVNMPYDILDELTAADFVLAVEPVGSVKTTLHAAAPAMGVDALRTYDATTGLFSGIGGASVPIGVMDTGLNVNHLDISSNRRSICGGNFESTLTPREEDQLLWFDDLGHGTHVTSIFAGSGTVAARFAGMAPLVQDIRIAKALDYAGSGTAVAWSRAQDWLSRPTACDDQPAAKPLVVNSSLGVGGLLWEARTVVERKLDAVVWRARQVHAIAAGNGGAASHVSFAATKNTLAVGATANDGRIADFSSRGPVLDGRLFPHVVGSGVDVIAALGRGSTNGFARNSGTSMSSPAVAGVAALAMDAVPDLRERPAAVRALLMASAVKPDAYFERRDLASLLTAGRGRFRLDNGDGPGELQNIYGLGKASARTSVLTRDTEDGWITGAAGVDVQGGSVGYQDIVVPAGASRLDVVMTWDEPAAETITPSVLNDLDLWIDRGADCAPGHGACGDHASRSQVDNVEWVILPNPPPGTYRLKAVPRRVYGAAPRAGIAWTVIRGPSTPTLAVAAERPVVAATTNRAFDVDLTLSVDGYVASGAVLRVDCRAQRGASACEMVEFIVPQASTATREDGISRPLGESSAAIAVGEIGAGEQQSVRLRFKPRADADNFRLHFTAKAWNATAASTSVEVRMSGAESPAPSPAQRPPNDDFAAATQLTGASGRAAPVHILLATDEPGEPALADESGARRRSVWYRWTAPATGPARFTISQEHVDDLSDEVSLTLFRGDRLVSLERLSFPKLGGGMTFFAEAGATYVIRLGLVNNVIVDPAPDGPRRYETPPIELRWGPGSAPVNDDFADAIALGAGTVVFGNNQGATLEAGELVAQGLELIGFFQEGIAASVWYRWTAPTTADWRFSVDRRHLRVLAFVGDNVASARLVSGVASQHATFPAREGDEYRIAVAAETALDGGTDYRLSWAPKPRTGSPHDDFAKAEPLTEFTRTGRFDLNNATVEPDEPTATGARTAWWSWEAPTDGEVTWRADTEYFEEEEFFGLRFLSKKVFAMRFAAFAGDSLATLTSIADTGSDHLAHTEFSFDATAGQRYWFSVGLPRDAALMATHSDIAVAFRWGPTPANDSLARAQVLEGASGMVSGSNEFATVERGEEVGIVGDSSLWWSWQPPEGDVWYRFALEEGSGGLAVYKRVGGGFGGLELVAVSSGAIGPHEVVFQAEEGARYVIRLGAHYTDVDESKHGLRGEFQLRWEVNGTPAWLRYAGRIVAGQVNDDGVALQLDSVIGGTINGDGTALYANTTRGLRVFERNPTTGALVLRQALDQVGPTPSTVLWHDASRSVVTGSCEGWHRFAAGVDSDGTPTLEHTGAWEGDSPCANSWSYRQNHTHTAKSAFLSPDGSVLYVVQGGRSIDAYAVDAQGQSLALVDSLGNFNFQGAAAHGDGKHLYAVGDDQLFVLRRDAETGALALVLALRDGDGTGAVIDGMTSVRMVALDKRDQYLFVFADEGKRTVAFDLRDDPGAPAFLDSVGVRSGPSAPPVFQNDDCFSAQRRNTAPAVDVFCNRFAYTVAVRLDGSVRQTEFLAPSQRDRFNRFVPFYDSGCGIFCVSTPPTSTQVGLASPDGRHVYAIYAKPEIVVFERFGQL